LASFTIRFVRSTRPAVVRRDRIVGAAGLVLGLASVTLIVYAVAR
jgi:hypothetical protein